MLQITNINVGDTLTVMLVKTRDQIDTGHAMGGKHVDDIGFGYLADGSPVAVELGRGHIGHDVHVRVSSILVAPGSLSPTGRIIYGKLVVKERCPNPIP